MDEYCSALAEHYIFELMRTFARATRALALYDTQTCLDLLDTLPSVHQRSPWVMAMVGKAHYEKTEYASVRGLLSLAVYVLQLTVSLM